MSDIQCASCGKMVSAQLRLCPHCHEALTPRVALRTRTGLGSAELGTRWIRRGLLFMLLAGISYALLGGHSPIPLSIPFEVAPWVTEYALPFLFIAGLGLVVFGFFRRSVG